MLSVKYLFYIQNESHRTKVIQTFVLQMGKRDIKTLGRQAKVHTADL